MKNKIKKLAILFIAISVLCPISAFAKDKKSEVRKFAFYNSKKPKTLPDGAENIKLPEDVENTIKSIKEETAALDEKLKEPLSYVISSMFGSAAGGDFQSSFESILSDKEKDPYKDIANLFAKYDNAFRTNRNEVISRLKKMSDSELDVLKNNIDQLTVFAALYLNLYHSGQIKTQNILASGTIDDDTPNVVAVLNNASKNTGYYRARAILNFANDAKSIIKSVGLWKN